MISHEKYKLHVQKSVEKKQTSGCLYKRLADDILKNINIEVFQLVEHHSKIDKTINILCSASPLGYVKLVANNMGWIGLGSYFDNNGNFIHLKKKEKIKILEENFPPSKYEYNFAISDSDEDIELLKLFNKHCLYKN